MNLVSLGRSFTLAATILAPAAAAQSASGLGNSIGQGTAGNWVPPAAPVALPGANVGGIVTLPAVTSIECITIEGLTHSWAGDLMITLRDPLGDEHLLMVRPGYFETMTTGMPSPCGHPGDLNLGDYTIIESGSPNSFPTTAPPAALASNLEPGVYNQSFDTGGALWPDGALGVFNTPLDEISGPAGDWVLVFYDWFPPIDDGSFTGWTIHFNGGGNCPALPATFTDACNGDGGNQTGCTDCPCNNDAPVGTIGGCLNSAGTSARLLGTGSASITAPDPDDLRFRAIDMTPSSFAVLVSGAALAPQNMANPCFGTGTGVQSNSLDSLRCAVQSTQRHGGRPVDSDGDVGFGSNGWGGPDGPPAGIAAASGFVAAQTRHFQAFYRELPGTSCGNEQNTTQAVTVTFTP